MPTPYVLNSPEARDIFTQLVLLYRGAEENLIRLVADAVSRGTTGTANHYEGQAMATAQLRREAERILAQLDGEVADAVQTMLLLEYEETAVVTAGGQLAQGVSGASIGIVATEVAGAIQSARQPILRQVDDVYRRVMAQAVVDRISAGAPRMDVVQQALNRCADKGVTAFVDQAGRQWSMDSYIEMTLRTGVNRAQNEGRRDGFRANGVELIITSSHKGSHPWCLPYQGRVLAMSGSAGPREVLTSSGETVVVEVAATLDEAVANGYHHPNCRHSDAAYVPGMPIPPHLDSDEEDYELTQRQRAIERHIRRWKLRKASALTDEETTYTNRKVRFWQAQMREHVKQRDWLVRQYDREKVLIPQ